MRFRLRNLGLVAALGVAAALLGGVVSGVFAQGTTVRIDSTEAQVGFEGQIDLTVHDLPAAGLGAWTIDINYDPSVAVPVQCDAKKGGICNGGYDENTIRVTGINAFGLQGEATLATVYLACVEPGDSDLALELSVFADATAGDPQTIDAKVEHGSFVCVAEPVEPTPKPTETPMPTVEGKLAGDANCSDTVDAVDASLILQYAAGLVDELPCLENADVNHDGSVNSIDANLVLQIGAGYI